MPYLTPDAAPSTERCRVLFIPDDKEWLSLVTGALSELTYADNYEQFGMATPDEVATRFRDMLALFVDCEPTMPDYIKLTDTKGNAAAGGTFTNGAWRTRDLNTENADSGGHCALSSNQFTLQPGTYDLTVFAPGYGVQGHICRLYDVTNSAEVIRGTSNFAGPGIENYSVLKHRFTIATATTYRIEHKCDVTGTTFGFGVYNAFGDGNIYTQVTLFKW